MNVGVSASSGNYVTFWNSGDKLNSYKEMKEAINMLEGEVAKWIIIQGNFVDRNAQVLTKANVSGFVTHKPDSYISHQTVLVSKKTFLGLGGFDSSLKVSADFKQITQLFLNSDPVFINHPAVLVEAGNFSALNHRAGRFESYIISIKLLNYKMRLVAVSNIISKEFGFLVKKIKRKFLA
jgi:hypothetical protein